MESAGGCGWFNIVCWFKAMANRLFCPPSRSVLMACNIILLGMMSGGLVLWSFAWQAYRKVINVSPMQVLKAVPSSGRFRDGWLGLVFLVLLVWSLIGLESLPWVLTGLFVVGAAFY